MIKSRWGSEARLPSPLHGRNAQPTQTRNSNGLDQFFSSLQGRDNLSILDFSGASQANVSFITNLGHRIYSEDVLTSIEEVFGFDIEKQSNPVRVEMFLNQVLDFPEEHFDGMLVWDTLQFLSSNAAQATVDRMSRVLRPNAYALAFFNADEKATSTPAFQYRISDTKNLQLTPRSTPSPAHFYNNRSIEKLFSNYGSLKFFLTRANLREVIAKR